MATSTPPPDDSDALLASLDDLRHRIEDARGHVGAPGPARRWGWVLGFAVLALLVALGGVALVGGDGDDDGDLAAGERGQVTATTETRPTTTAAPSTTVAEPTTTAAPATTQVPAPEPEPAQPSERDDPSRRVQPDGARTGEHTVAPGESFWSIAEDVAGEGASLEAVTSVWVDLLAANADRLVEPGNPDLIVPGQVLVLPGSAPSP